MKGGWAALAALFLLTRVPLYEDHFYNWDATQLGLALDDLDLRAHQPHPPGYLLYVGLGRAVRALGASPERTYQVLATALTGAGLIGLYVLARRFLNRRGATIALVAGIAHPYVWAYGIVGESYAAELAASTWIGIACVDAWRGRATSALWSGLLLGLCGGIRTSVTLLLAPLLLMALWRGAHPWRVRLGAVGLAAAGVAAWLVPTADLAGGWEEYLALVRGLTMDVVAAQASPLFGDHAAGALRNTIHVLAWTGVTLAPLGLPALVLALAGRAPRTAVEARPPLGHVVATWSIPAFAFYLLVFASKPGYLLTVLAPLVTGCAAVVDRGIDALAVRMRRARPAWIAAGVGAVAAGIGTASFLFAEPGSRVGIALPHIRASEALLERALAVARAEETAAGPGRTVFVANLALPDWRRFAYYHTGAPAWHLVSSRTYPGLSGRLEACVSQARRMRCLSWQDPPDAAPRERRIPIPAATTQLVVFSGGIEHWLTAALARVTRPIVREVDGFRYEVADVTGLSELRLGPFRFVREP